MSSPSTDHRVALVTGGGSGIGAATVARLSRDGLCVYAADINGDTARLVAHAAERQGGRAFALSMDVTREEDWRRGVATIMAAHARFDVLVQAAGISAACPIVDTDLDQWRRVMAVNLDAVFLGVKHTLPAMGERGGCIVTISSASGIKATAGATAYTTSKAAVTAFTRAAALECHAAGKPVRLNVISPGAVRTPLWKTMSFFQELVRQHGSEEAAFASLAREMPGGRFAEPEEIASAVAYLVSPEARSMQGAEWVMDGGFVLT